MGSPFCGTEAGENERLGVVYYLDMRQAEAEVGTVCGECKSRSLPFAVDIARDLEAERLLDEAKEYHELIATLMEETRPIESCNR